MLWQITSGATSNDFLITVLASGSAGNCTLIREGDVAYFIDLGVSARRLVEYARSHHVRLTHPKSDRPNSVPHGAVITATSALLTHTHNDHVVPAALGLVACNGMTLHAHSTHAKSLQSEKHFAALQNGKNISLFTEAPFQVSGETFAYPVRLSHDAEHTFGFVFVHRGVEQREHKFSYLADLGTFDNDIVEAAADSDVLALEFNHDPDMERNSGRPAATIQRVLGPYGHLSNGDAAHLLTQILKRSHRTRRPHTLILLHLSQDCNSPRLAVAEARRVLERHSPETQVLVARQTTPLPPISLARGSLGR
ncbi:MAG: MBL fold metallo-hydrolase [Candidatus Sumerlaeaceae bacterium]|nr:MBL fold metallo-hydrolase [Candidatus Sumerlaeaceae bacterium]